MENNWKKIWESKSADKEFLKNNFQNNIKVFLELKRINGFDALGNELTADALLSQYEYTKEMLFRDIKEGTEKSVFEVGCGSGANLYMFEKDEIKTGGLDYSHSLIETAKSVLRTDDLICSEAINLQTDVKFLSVLSNSVFSYFPDYEYANSVLEKIYLKTEYSIGLIDIHNIEKKDDFINYRRKNLENYDELYHGLPKLFYSRDLFSRFASEHNMKIEFTCSDMDGYWNNDFVFNCFMYKK